MTSFITAKSVKSLVLPKRNSKKSDNGVLAIVGGSKLFHGAPLLSIKTASKFVDLIYFYSPEASNVLLAKKIKSSTTDVIVFNSFKAFKKKALPRADCLLVGPGLGVSEKTRRLVNSLVKSFGKKIVLDADGLKVVDKNLLNERVLVTPHAKEFEKLFGLPASEENVLLASKKFGCVVLLKKGEVSLVSDGNKKNVFVNCNGNAGMTKGGTGDVLAGLCAAFACRNDLLLSAKTACFLNGFAGDLLFKKKSFAFNASDLVEEISFAFANLLRGKVLQ